MQCNLSVAFYYFAPSCCIFLKQIFKSKLMHFPKLYHTVDIFAEWLPILIWDYTSSWIWIVPGNLNRVCFTHFMKWSVTPISFECVFSFCLQSRAMYLMDESVVPHSENYHYHDYLKVTYFHFPCQTAVNNL